MNDLQEAVFDALMAADRIGGEYRRPGPLRLAAQALHAAGLLRGIDREVITDTPGACLGLPRVLADAIEGAARALPTADECRRFAISLFSAVSPRERAPRLTARQLIEVARWSLAPVPALSPGLDSLAAEVAGVIAQYLDGLPCPDSTIQYLGEGLVRAAEQVEPTKGEFTAGRLALNAHYFALHALRREQRGDGAEGHVAFVARDVGRLTGLVQGAAGAIPYCLGLARKVGM